MISYTFELSGNLEIQIVIWFASLSQRDIKTRKKANCRGMVAAACKRTAFGAASLIRGVALLLALVFSVFRFLIVFVLVS